jgi:hypothetical protein
LTGLSYPVRKTPPRVKSGGVFPAASARKLYSITRQDLTTTLKRNPLFSKPGSGKVTTEGSRSSAMQQYNPFEFPWKLFIFPMAADLLTDVPHP